jgi:Tol biopolymer transport system component
VADLGAQRSHYRPVRTESRGERGHALTREVRNRSRRRRMIEVARGVVALLIVVLMTLGVMRLRAVRPVEPADQPNRVQDTSSRENASSQQSRPEGDPPRSEPAGAGRQKAGGRATSGGAKGGGGNSPSEPDLVAFNRGDMISLVFADGSGLNQLTRGVAPSWSFDGKRLAFTASGGIHVINADGSGRRSLPGPVVSNRTGRLPVWSPGGSQIAFNWPDDTSKPGCHPEWEGTGGSGPECGIGMINADGTDARWLGTGRWPDWGPDGRIVFADGVPSEPCHYSDTHTYSQAVLETSTRTRLPACALPLWVMNADGSGRTLLAANKAIRPSWSPDGKRIAFYTETEGSFVINAAGSDSQSIAPAGFMDPSWFPNGQSLAFTYQKQGGTRGYQWSVYVRSLDGQLSKQLTSGPGDTVPAVAPRR